MDPYDTLQAVHGQYVDALEFLLAAGIKDGFGGQQGF